MADLPTTVNVVEQLIKEAPEDFFTICPRSKKFGQYNIQPVKLKVIQTKGVEVIPSVNTKVNEFDEYTQIVNNKGGNDRFKIDIIIHKNETVTGQQHISIHSEGVDSSSVAGLVSDVINDGIQENEVNLFLPVEDLDIEDDMYDANPLIYVLNYWVKNATPLYVVTDAIDISNGEYVIINNPSRKQTYHYHTIWTLEFIRYKEWVLGRFKNNNKVVQDAIKSYNNKKNKKSSNASNTVSQSTSLKNQMKSCDYKVLKYSKKKKVVPCVKTLQSLLNHYVGSKLSIDGWFGSETVKAVKKFQKKYKKMYKLTVDGKVNKATWKALYTGGSTAVQVGKTKTIKATNLPTGIIKSK